MAPVKKIKKDDSSASKSGIKRVKGENFYRNAKQAARVKMLQGGKPVYDRDGKIKQAALFQKGEDETQPGRVQPDRRWFGNTRVISQSAMDHFRSSLATKAHDPYSVLLRRNKLPMGLLDEALNPNSQKRPHIVETEPFGETFGPKAQRKRPRIEVGTFEELSRKTQEESEALENEQEAAAGQEDLQEEERTHKDYIEPIFAKGTSRRIYGELYKVIDSSDVLLHILDARDPLGSMCVSVLDFIKKEKSHKQVVLIINKCDLVPNWVTARYIQHLTPKYPTLAFHASQNHPFGKGALIQLLRQFSQLHSDKKQISVGFIGYPNVGKSSVINTLKSGKVCKVAPIPGETKVWQYITLTRKIYLIDCPGIVPTSSKDTTTATVLKGVVRVEALPNASDHVQAVLDRVKPVYLSRTYGTPVPSEGVFEAETFLDQLARKRGRLLKGGEPDLESVAKIVLSDWVRGRIPFFVPPPERPEGLDAESSKKESSKKRLVVQQKLGGIVPSNKYVAEDTAIAQENQSQSEEDGNEEEGSESETDAEDDELKWTDVFPTDAENVPAPDADDESAVQDEAQGDSESSKAEKDKRMKTNKKKATNFYTNANVKNKNKNKKGVGMAAIANRRRRR